MFEAEKNFSKVVSALILIYKHFLLLKLILTERSRRRRRRTKLEYDEKFLLKIP